jgi:hypothetical protein
MFSPLILICSMAGPDTCQTPPAPVFPTLEQCEAATEAYVNNRLAPALSPGTFVVKWRCFDWGASA